MTGIEIELMFLLLMWMLMLMLMLLMMKNETQHYINEEQQPATSSSPSFLSPLLLRSILDKNDQLRIRQITGPTFNLSYSKSNLRTNDDSSTLESTIL